MKERDEINLETYPKEFQRFLKEEIEIVKNLVTKDDKVLDIGCGNGRAIPQISPFVSEYVGIDIDEIYLSKAKTIAKKFENSKVIKSDIYNLSKLFKENEFDKTFSLFNTISSLRALKKIDYKKALKEIYHITKDKFYFSVCGKGAKEIRQKYYGMIGVEVKFDKNETSYSKAWGQVKAFDKDEIMNICKEVGFKIEKIPLMEKYSYGIIVSK